MPGSGVDKQNAAAELPTGGDLQIPQKQVTIVLTVEIPPVQATKKRSVLAVTPTSPHD